LYDQTTCTSISGVARITTHLHLVVVYNRNKYGQASPEQIATATTSTRASHPLAYPRISASKTTDQAMAPEAQASCAVCGEPALYVCSGCKLDTSLRQYCGKACQTKDWPTHKKACKYAQNAILEKRLERVAEVVKQAYYSFRKNTWDKPIDNIEDREDALVIHYGAQFEQSKYFAKFPQHLMPTKQVKDAVLCLLMCNEPLAYMYSVVVKLLKGNAQ
jgi:hypothetical protein